MKSSSPRLPTKPDKRTTQAAVPAAFAKNTRTAAHGQVHAVPGKKVVRVKSINGGSLERQAGDFVAFAGSSVAAHDAVMKGVSGRALARIWESTKGVLSTDAILKAIGVSARTAHRIKTDPDKPLDARTTDGIYRLESVRAMAQEVLGSEEAANEWLDTEAMGLEFRKPIDLVSTSPGAEAVKTLLQRMKYGVYA
jgi:putative toxin-antitoxin system antitoxin component (TIGR02293 family)